MPLLSSGDSHTHNIFSAKTQERFAIVQTDRREAYSLQRMWKDTGETCLQRMWSDTGETYSVQRTWIDTDETCCLQRMSTDKREACSLQRTWTVCLWLCWVESAKMQVHSCAVTSPLPTGFSDHWALLKFSLYLVQYVRLSHYVQTDQDTDVVVWLSEVFWNGAHLHTSQGYDVLLNYGQSFLDILCSCAHLLFCLCELSSKKLLQALFQKCVYCCVL